MFTGIIEALGSIKGLEKKGEDIRLTIDVADLDMSDVQIGDSIAVNGVCLTAVKFDQRSFVADVSNETIRYSSFQFLKTGDSVNLEKALTPTTRLGGHLVSGHVDGLGKVLDRYEDGRAIRFIIEAPESLAKYIAAKGSVCVDGISLTVNEIDHNKFYLNIVPHTAEKTNVQNWQNGKQVNIEIDVIARYLERLILSGSGNNQGTESSKISESFLAEYGFMRK